MSSLAELQERRELLLARSALQRLEIARDLHELRGAVRLPRAGVALGALALGVAGATRFRRVIRVAAFGFALFKLARAWVRR